MKNLILFIGLVLATSTSFAQKMAHADINAILSVMPENEKINEDLKIYATGLSKGVEDSKAQLDAAIYIRDIARNESTQTIDIDIQTTLNGSTFFDFDDLVEEFFSQSYGLDDPV